MKKLIYIAVMLTLFVSSTPLALATNDAVLQEGAQFSVNSMTFTTDGTLDEIVVYSTYFTLTLSSSSNINIYSADKYTFSVSPSNVYVTFTCTSAQSKLAITGSGNQTYTITPSNTVCTSALPVSSGGGSASGGGGGAGATSATAAPLANLDSLSSGGGSASLVSPATQAISAASGGEVALSNNAIEASLPANAVSTDATLTITPQATYAEPTAGYTAIGSQVYNISAQSSGGATITQLNNTATLTFTYTDEQITGITESTLVVSYWNETTGQWVDLPTTVNATNNTVTATTSHFTKFILQGKATTAPAGSLVKTASNPAVYYIGHDGKRYTFSDDKVYKTWYENFNDVLTITSDEMFSYSIGGTVTARPGTKLVQFVTYNYAGQMVVDDPKIYAIEPGGTKHWIKTAEIAASLYGADWEQKIYAVPNSLAGNYATGADIESVTYPTGSLVVESASNNLYYISVGQKRLVSTNGLTSNRFQTQYYNSAATLTSYPTIAALNDYQNSISWTGGK